VSQVFLSYRHVPPDEQLAHELLREEKMTIFPVRLDFHGKLPYDLGSALDGIQYALWRPGDSEEELFARLHAAITGGASLPVTSSSEDTAVLSITDPAVAAERKGAPLPAAEPRIVMETGTIRLDSPFYVRRREDGIAESCLAQPGSTIVVKGPRQSG
jgi:hypothetical protein